MNIKNNEHGNKPKVMLPMLWVGSLKCQAEEKKNRCPFCGAKRDTNNFFWLEVDKNDRVQCESHMELGSDIDEDNYDYIEIECCPKCQAEMI